MKNYKLIANNEYSKIEVRFNYGGINYMNYKKERKGVYIHFSKVTRKQENGYVCESFMMFDNNSFKILAIELNRKSKKQYNIVCNWVENNIDILHELYLKDDRNKLLNIIQNAFCVKV